MDQLAPARSSGLDLAANLTRLMHGAVHIHIELTRLEARVLLVGELRSGRNHPHAFGIPSESDNGRTALAGRANMNVRHRSLDGLRFDRATDRLVRRNGNGP